MREDYKPVVLAIAEKWVDKHHDCAKLQSENEALRKRIEKLESELEDAAEPIVVLPKLDGLSQLERDILVKAEQVLYSEPLLNKQEYFNKFLGDGKKIK